MQTYNLDAKNMKLGRLATQAASILMGKNSTSFVKNEVQDVKVVVSNASAMDISFKKKDEKVYTRFSGYPSGLKEETLAQVVVKKGYAEVLRKAVYGMLPGNRLRVRRMKNLVITE